jgi:hypothetical protein
VTSVTPVAPDAKPSKAWIGLLTLAIIAILVLAMCIAGVFYDVSRRVPAATPTRSPSPSKSVVPTPPRTEPGSASPFADGSAAG